MTSAVEKRGIDPVDSFIRTATFKAKNRGKSLHYSFICCLNVDCNLEKDAPGRGTMNDLHSQKTSVKIVMDK